MTVTVNRKGSKSMSKKRIKSICIYCGSRLGVSIEYAHSAKILGETIARNNLKLVYGGGNIGIMGVLAESCRKNNGRILGVMPHILTKKEQGKENISNYIITEDMHERKKVMYMNSDMIIALPGGIGTLEELFEMITWKQLGLHDKPIYLLNILGYWDNLIHSFNQIIKDGFIEKEATNYFKICESVDAIFFDLKKEGLIESYE